MIDEQGLTGDDHRDGRSLTGSLPLTWIHFDERNLQASVSLLRFLCDPPALGRLVTVQSRSLGFDADPLGGGVSVSHNGLPPLHFRVSTRPARVLTKNIFAFSSGQHRRRGETAFLKWDSVERRHKLPGVPRIGLFHTRRILRSVSLLYRAPQADARRSGDASRIRPHLAPEPVDQRVAPTEHTPYNSKVAASARFARRVGNFRIVRDVGAKTGAIRSGRSVPSGIFRW